tara:strand:- start:3147 stop:4238 length:1092 start_codon:yes stop_codon:yes gene_type:complete
MIGFLINPIAGLGGTVGLKGTDGNTYKKALELGGTPLAAQRARVALSDCYTLNEEYLTCSGTMGEDVLRDLKLKYKIIHKNKKKTTAKDTKKACIAFLKMGVDLILFSGGDGTAKDIVSVVKKRVPILGIPSGVKMHSSIFAINPNTVKDLLCNFHNMELSEGEILDVDEKSYQADHFNVQLFGYAITLKAPYRVQGRKNTFYEVPEDRSKEEIAKFVLEFMEDKTTYILSAGTTIKKICDLIGVEKTLLGVDVLKNGKVIAKDTNEKQLLKIVEQSSEVVIIVSPIGSQGFIFGRGNQQISSKVIKKVGISNIIILSTPHKLSQTPHLFVDTGDLEIDKKLSGKKRIITSYRMTTLRIIKSP